jgi:hypothetical protein
MGWLPGKPWDYTTGKMKKTLEIVLPRLRRMNPLLTGCYKKTMGLSTVFFARRGIL